MQHFTSVHDVHDINHWVEQALQIKANPYQWHEMGKHKTIGLVFLNPSLRTRLSTQKAAMNLGMNVMVMNMDKEGWALEFGDGAIMNGTTVEHVKDAAAVMGQYCDIIGIRCFPSLTDRNEDNNETILNKFIQYAKVPVVSLESATRHPLQSFADMITILENWKHTHKPKVVLTWAPHIKALPQAVPNSFSEWMCRADVDFVITHPEGLELNNLFTKGATITHNQQEALQGSDFVYVKNWSGYHDYGKPYENGADWLLTEQHLASSNNAKLMHCLPVRRNVELTDVLLDGPNSLVLQQAGNRLFAAQTVLKNILEQHG
ncbi:MAG: N-acetylornithine carbamoyltransferase [Bacteroidota bacterium]